MMKNLIVAFLGMGIATSVMARYWVYNIRMSVAGDKIQEGKGKKKEALDWCHQHKGKLEGLETK